MVSMLKRGVASRESSKTVSKNVEFESFKVSLGSGNKGGKVGHIVTEGTRLQSLALISAWALSHHLAMARLLRSPSTSDVLSASLRPSSLSLIFIF
jgi:hypothetical protein